MSPCRWSDKVTSLSRNQSYQSAEPGQGLDSRQAMVRQGEWAKPKPRDRESRFASCQPQDAFTGWSGDSWCEPSCPVPGALPLMSSEGGVASLGGLV